MPIVAAVAVPHPPLLIPGVGDADKPEVAKTAAAFACAAQLVAEAGPQALAVFSPHATLYSDYFHISPGEGAVGDFSQFVRKEPPRYETAYDTELAAAIVRELEAAGIPGGFAGQREPALDHGTMLPLHFLAEAGLGVPIVRIGLSGMSLEVHWSFGRCVSRAVAATGRRTAIIASGDLSHYLCKDGSYGYRPEGPAFDAQVCDILAAGDLSALLELDERLSERAGECGLRSLVMLGGALEDAVGLSAELLSYEGPFGVGYAVASFTAPDGQACQPRCDNNGQEDGRMCINSQAQQNRQTRQARQAHQARHPEICRSPEFAEGKAQDQDLSFPSSKGNAQDLSFPPTAGNAQDLSSTHPDGSDPAADAACAQSDGGPGEAEAPGSCEAEHSLPVALAWANIRAYLETGSAPSLSSPAIAALIVKAGDPHSAWHGDLLDLADRKAGAFVSLHVASSDELRGCIGTTEGNEANVLAEIVRNAVSAASEDPRFAPLAPEELGDLHISVDVLGTAEVLSQRIGLGDVHSLAADGTLDAQRYGVIVSQGWRRGLLLPALDGVDTPEHQVAIALNKAGIAASGHFMLSRFEVVRYK